MSKMAKSGQKTVFLWPFFARFRESFEQKPKMWLKVGSDPQTTHLEGWFGGMYAFWKFSRFLAFEFRFFQFLRIDKGGP